MPPEASGSTGPGDARRPDGWPDDEADDRTDPSWPPPPPAGRHGPPRHGHLRTLALAAVAVVALAAGAGGALAVSRELATTSPPATPPASQPSGGPVSGSGPSAGSSGTAELFTAGRVLGVTPTSITIGGPGHRVTAAVTAATRVTGTATSIRSVKVGDHVSARITESGGKATATEIQDPGGRP